jgi:Carboxypeptidase regulatory-like domain
MKTRHLPWPFLAATVLLIAACGAAGAPSAPPGTGLSIAAAAGPTCPVESIPPDPACAPRPVAGASIVIKDRQGKTVATVVTGANGTASIGLPAGTYMVEPQPAAGLMGTAGSQAVTVADGAMTPVLLAYDTGIR